MLIVVVFFGCNAPPIRSIDANKNVIEGIMNDGYKVLIIEGCEYIAYQGYNSSIKMICHKGNCKYCMYRNNK